MNECEFREQEEGIFASIEVFINLCPSIHSTWSMQLQILPVLSSIVNSMDSIPPTWRREEEGALPAANRLRYSGSDFGLHLGGGREGGGGGVRKSPFIYRHPPSFPSVPSSASGPSCDASYGGERRTVGHLTHEIGETLADEEGRNQ